MSNIKSLLNNSTDFSLFTTPDFVPKDKSSNSAAQDLTLIQLQTDEPSVKLRESQDYGNQIAYALKGRLATSATNVNTTIVEGDNARAAQIKKMILEVPVPKKEMNQIIDILRNDPDLPNTIAELDRQKLMPSLLKNIFYAPQRRELISVLGKAAQNDDARWHIEPHIGQRLQAKWQVQYTLERMGLKQPAPSFDTSKYQDVVGKQKNSPFSGSGASGINQKDATIPLADQAQLLIEDKLIPGRQATEDLYKNPTFKTGQLEYLKTLSPEDRKRQVELLFNQQVNSTMPEIYGGKFPSRADVIRTTAKINNVEPELVAAFILAEQRDQSQNEDAAEYTSATKVGHNSSIGLGQVLISTANRYGLFSDLVANGTRSQLGNNEVATLLADDAVNIFAVARYLRQVANEGAKKSDAEMSDTRVEYSGLRMADYAKNSSEWSAGNIAALGSEYTSRQWDNKLEAEWGHYVYECYKDVKASGVFK